MADETTRVDAWLQAKLTGDATLYGLIGGAPPNARVYADAAPQGAAFPAVIHQLQGVHDVRTATSAARIMVSGLWLVKAVDRVESYMGGLAAIADRIDFLLEGSGGGAAGVDGVVFASVREASFRLPEDDNGVQYRHLGGLYRIVAQIP